MSAPKTRIHFYISLVVCLLFSIASVIYGSLSPRIVSSDPYSLNFAQLVGYIVISLDVMFQFFRRYKLASLFLYLGLHCCIAISASILFLYNYNDFIGACYGSNGLSCSDLISGIVRYALLLITELWTTHTLVSILMSEMEKGAGGSNKITPLM
ncbi:hypothetical protein EDD86DRAFT_207887, partial [Gorgonomyces haynaldii]